MIDQVRLVFKQMKFMYSDARVNKWCDESESLDNERDLKIHLHKMARKFENPEMIRVADAVSASRWDEVFYKGFLESLPQEAQSV